MNANELLSAFKAGEESPPPALDGKALLRLVWRTWPFIRPVLKHVIALALIGIVSGVFWLGLTVLATDVFMNKILVGERIEAFQADLLRLDGEYVANGTEDEPLMTAEQRKTVRNRMVVWFGVGALVGLASLAALPYYQTWVKHRINQNLRVAMIERAEHLSLKYHDHAQVGDAVFRVYQDSAMIVNLIDEAIVGPLAMLYALASGIVFISFFSPHVALGMISMAVPMVWLTVKFTPRVRRRARANRVANSQLTSRLQQAFSVVKIVKANRAEHRVLERFDRDSHRALDAAFLLRLEMVLLSALVMTIGGAALITTEYVLAGWVVVEAETYLGALVAGYIGFTVWNIGAFNTARGQTNETLGSGYGLVRVWCMAQDLFIGLDRAFHLLDLEPDVVDPVDPRSFPEPLARVAFRDLHFAYQPDKPVLEGVNFSAEAGTVTALLGATGAGKSTLMSLVLRLHDPDTGRVELQGIDLRDLRIDDIRANTAIALQKNILFAGTVADNIGYTAADATRGDIEAAARVACADEFIRDLEQGYETELGERGAKLSTGQRQRLSIARAIVRDTPILILDEPTASLDAQTEARLMANLAEWGRHRVVFLITHRLSTVRNADQIAFLEDGRIAEFGGHDQLMALGGRYRDFVEAEMALAQR